MQPNWRAAERHLRKDPILAGVIKRVGPCKLAPRNDHFISLCRAIYAQQISVKIATTLYGRFASKFPRKTPTPARVVEALTTWKEEEVRHCGLSRQKRGYVLDLASHFANKKIAAAKFGKMTDEQIIEALTAVKGVGEWTAQMHLIFVLNRPNVLPTADLGLREAVRIFYKLPDRPKVDELKEIAAPWTPYRSVATWYMWRGLHLERGD